MNHQGIALSHDRTSRICILPHETLLPLLEFLLLFLLYAQFSFPIRECELAWPALVIYPAHRLSIILVNAPTFVLHLLAA